MRRLAERLAALPGGDSPGQAGENAAAAFERGFAAGIAEGMQRAEAGLAVRLDQAQQETQAALVEARRNWVEAEGDVLRQALESGLAAFEQTLTQELARSLTPVLQEHAAAEALRSFAAMTRELLASGSGLAVSGPGDLLDRAFGAAELAACAVTRLGEGQPDLRAVSGDTLIETRIADWARGLSEACR